MKNRFGNLKKSAVFNQFIPAFYLLIISLIFFYPVLFKGKDALPTDALVGAHVPWTEIKWEKYPAGVPIKNQEITDSFSQFYPWRSLVGEFWRAGRVPLWNSYMFSGTPFLATWHSAAIYPLNVVYLFLSNIASWNMLVFLQIILSGVFMFLFLKEIGLKNVASIFGGIVFMFSGYMIAWLEFATGGQAGLWFPLLLLFEHRLFKVGKSIWIIPIAMTFFFIFTAGDFQIPFYCSLAYLLFSFFLNFSFKPKRFNFKNWLKAFIGLVMGILLSAPQLLPTMELFKQSVRVEDPYIKEYFFGIMNWEKVVNFIWPDFFGNIVTGNYWGKYGYHEYLSFGGVSALVFLSFSLFTRKVKIEKYFWLVMFLSLLFLFPTPIAFLPFYLKIPGLGTSSASRIIFLVDFCLAVLSAYGFSKWLNKDDKKLVRIVGYYLITTIGVMMGLVGSIYWVEEGSNGLKSEIVVNLKVALRNMIPSTLVFVFLFIILFTFFLVKKKFRILTRFLNKLVIISVVFILTWEMLRFAWKNTPFSPKEFLFPETEIIKFLKKDDDNFRMSGGIPLNLFMPFKLSSVEGYDPIFPLLNSQWFSMVNWGHPNSLSGRYGQIHYYNSPLINFGNVKYIVDYKKNRYGEISEGGSYAAGIENSRYKQVFSEGRIEVFENTQNLPRAWLTTNIKVVGEAGEVIDELNKISNTWAKLVILNQKTDIKDVKNVNLGTIDEFKQSFNEIEIKVSGEEKALLFLSETYYPGWRAYIDGKKTEILRANYFYQAILLPAGYHDVRFIYQPESFKIGKWLFLLVTTGMVGFYTYEKFSKRGG